MPYAEPTSPIPSPRKEHSSSSRKGWMSPPIDDEAVASSGPMPGIPRRSSSATSTPRRGMSPSVSRLPSASGTPIDGLPRRSGEALGASDSLGLRLSGHASPSKAPIMSRGSRNSNSSSSTVEDPMPQTPQTLSFGAYDSAASSSSRLNRRPTLTHSHSAAQGHHRGGISGGSLQINLATSSSPNLEATSAQYLRPTTSMIRKKSGEVVKPSLKQRSMSTPDLTRRGSDGSDDNDAVDATASARDLQEHAAKSVRFAGSGDGDDGGLESVVLFLREQKVTAVSRAADQDGSVQTETETENDTDASDFVQFRTRRNAAAKAADESSDIELNLATPIPRKRVDFGPDARGSLKDEHVILERIDLQSNLALVLRGTILVRNISFQKWIAVRFTLDQWQTTSEVTGTHVNHIPASTTQDEGWDRFAFTIKLEDYRRKIDERELCMCLRYSANGQDWWDSNEGRNYKFTFKKVAPRRPAPRGSGAATFGGGFLRLTDDSGNVPTLRSGRGGATPRLGGGGRPWVFPTKPSATVERSDSPAPTPPPAASFRAPAPPDVHTHLNLSRWCAPSSPPQSPPKDKTQPFALHVSTTAAPLSLAPSVEASDMSLVNGQYATISPPTARSVSLPTSSSADAVAAEVQAKSPTKPLTISTHRAEPVASSSHTRNKSWSAESTGSSSESTTSASTAVPDVIDLDDATPRDGESTPTADGARSPETSSSPDVPLTMKRSTGNLRALVEGSPEVGLFTPPSSNLSSPPFPSLNGLPPVEPMSPSPSASTGSTGGSSPVTVGSDSQVDLGNIDISVDPEHARTLNANSYQDFLRKFCFFESPIPMPTTLDPHEPVYRKPTYIPLSGYSSPTGAFSFYSHSSNSPRSTPTPTRQFDTAGEAFGFGAIASGAGAGASGMGGGTGGTTPVLASSPQFQSTPKPSPPNGMVATAASAMVAAAAAQKQKEHKWHTHGDRSPSLAARS